MSRSDPFISALRAGFAGCAPKRACGRSPGEFAKRLLLPGRRGPGEAGSEEERRYLKDGKKYEKMRYLNIFARIPLQSPPEGGDSFPPGEAVSSCVEVYRAASIRSASWRMRVEIQAVSMIRRTCPIRCRAPV